MTYEELDFEINEECADYLVKIRQDLSDIEQPQHVLDLAVGSPKGIYEMVMELKQLHKETETNLMTAYATANAQQERRRKAEDKQIELEKENKRLRDTQDKLIELLKKADEHSDRIEWKLFCATKDKIVNDMVNLK